MRKTFGALREIAKRTIAIEKEAIRFDNGNETAGVRMRKTLLNIRRDVEDLRKEIQKTRYYREAYQYYIGRRRFISGLKYKEKKYGSVDEVARLQILQKSKNNILKRT